ncbi:MAG: hypothetical protein HQK61_08950, partial [Desulfamplus sp.]|nr:hypothetical protein [Desulfamplus sp.]
KNLVNSNAQLFGQYFKALGLIGCMPNLLVAHIIETFISPLNASVLHIGLVQAFGTAAGALLNISGMLVAGLIFYGTGIFLFGEILPILRKTRSPLSVYVLPLIGAILVVPYIPVGFPAVIGAITRVKFRSMVLLLACALTLRAVLLIAFLPTGLL